jgi:prophage tail gpP-like protein
MLENHELTLIVDGRKFGGWLDVRVGRGIERAAGDFEIRSSQRWPGQDERFEIPEGSRCEIMIGDDKVLTGYVDVIAHERDDNAANLTISGRSKTADLVDCSPDFELTELAGLDLAAVARKLAAPFGIEVDAKTTGATFPVASANHGETAWKVIERLARQRGILVMDDPEGRLLLTQLATERATDELVHPADGLLKIATKRDMSKRFSVYKVKAQAGGRWAGFTEGNVATALAHVEGSFRDSGVPRYRPKTLLNEGAAKKEGTMARAEYEARRNLGRGLQVRATRVAWRQRDGALWRPNILVQCSLPQLNVEGTLAIGEVTYRKGASGTVSELELMPPEAFTPEPPEAPGGEGGGSGLRWGGFLKSSGGG